MVEVGVAAGGEVEPRLELAEPAGGLPEADGPRVVAAVPKSALVEVRGPGDQRFCVSAENPAERLDAYRIFTGFAPSLDGKDGGKKETEPDPDPLLWAPPHQLALDALCRDRLEDDVADALRCAAPLGASGTAEARLGNPWHDDVDVFTFTVEELATVRLESSGDLALRGTLYDHRGYRLAVSDAGGGGEGFAIVKALVPGRYYVAVASSAGHAGAYRLSLER